MEIKDIEQKMRDYTSLKAVNQLKGIEEKAKALGFKYIVIKQQFKEKCWLHGFVEIGVIEEINTNTIIDEVEIERSKNVMPYIYAFFINNGRDVIYTPTNRFIKCKIIF